MAVSVNRKTVIQTNHSDIFQEYVATEAITPGAFVEPSSSTKVANDSTTGGTQSEPAVAVEDLSALQGGGIDTDYATDDQVSVWYPMVGDKVLMILADDENASDGDYLESYGGTNTGTLHVNNSTSASVQFKALEALDLSDSSGAESSDATLGYGRRILVRRVA